MPFIAVLFLVSCKKDKKGCWQAVDKLGAVVTGLTVCDLTQSEAEAMYPQFWFYNTREPVYCWKVQRPGSSPVYAADLPESIIKKLFISGNTTFTIIDCSSYCIWEVIEKRKNKITNLFDPTRLYVETYFTDTCSKLFVGRIITYRETTDSLITREYSKKLH